MKLGRHTTSNVELWWCRIPEDARVSYAGPDGSKTLPDADAAGQFFVAWDSSHPVCHTSFTEMAARHSAA
ncbi:hypothetical protein, partial [Streptomyces niveus]